MNVQNSIYALIGLFAPCIKAPRDALFRWNLSRVSALVLPIDTQPGGRNINPTRWCGASTQLGQPNEWPRRAGGTVVLHLKSHRTERVGHHGYPDTSHHYCSCSSPWRRRLVRPGTLVLGATQSRYLLAGVCLSPVKIRPDASCVDLIAR